MNFKRLEEVIRIKNKQIPRWIFLVLICFIVLSIFIWCYQQNNLDSLNNKIESLNKSVSTGAPIPKDELDKKINELQQNINILKVEDNAKKDQIISKIAELKKINELRENDLRKTVVSLERLTFEKDLLTLKKEVVKEQNGVVVTIIQAFSGLFLFTTFVLSALNFKATEDKQISERFIQAVEMLGANPTEKIDIILGGIYALERIAKDSEKDHWVIMEVLTAFVRRKTQYKNDDSEHNPGKIAIEVQLALTVIGRSDFWKDRDKQKLNLKHTSLKGVELQKAKLRNVDFEQAYLTEAHFDEADLRDANFKNARLGEAHFKESDLRGTIFKNADLKETNFVEANVDKTDFSESLNLGENIQSAKYFKNALYNDKQRKTIFN